MKSIFSAIISLAIGLAAVPVSGSAAFAQQGMYPAPRPFMSQSPQIRYFQRNGNRAYYQGQRGYRYQRPGYQSYNGFWFPAAALFGAAIVGGIMNGGSNQAGSHVAYCQNRYRSYRMSDNTFQPNVGPRRACR